MGMGVVPAPSIIQRRKILVDVSDIFNFFRLWGRGCSGCLPGGGRFFFFNSQEGGGGFPRRGGGAERPGGCLWGISGGGGKFCFSGPKFPPRDPPEKIHPK